MPPLPVIIVIALLAVGAGVFLIFRLSGPNGKSQRLLATAVAEARVPASVKSSSTDPSPFISLVLDRFGRSKKMQWHLLQAGLLVRPSELVALALGVAGVGFVTGTVIKGYLVGVPLAALGMAMPFLYVNFRKKGRRKTMVAQLGDALSMMSSSLRSGYSFMRAMQVVSDEMDPPIAEEFGRVLDELNVGVNQERALQHLADRCPNPDIDLVVTACQIQANVGGNLAEVLDTTSDMIRERVRLQGEIAALTAEGRLSAGILGSLPIVLAIAVSRLSPGYLDPLIQTPIGIMVLGAGIAAMITGMLVIRKLLAVQI